jgi:hypothetical protein
VKLLSVALHTIVHEAGHAVLTVWHRWGLDANGIHVIEDAAFLAEDWINRPHGQTYIVRPGGAERRNTVIAGAIDLAGVVAETLYQAAHPDVARWSAFGGARDDLENARRRAVRFMGGDEAAAAALLEESREAALQTLSRPKVWRAVEDLVGALVRARTVRGQTTLEGAVVSGIVKVALGRRPTKRESHLARERRPLGRS